MPGEFDFIQWVRTQQPASDLVSLPAGDDLAVLNWAPGDLLLVGVDQVLDGVHFDSAVHDPRAIGRKAMNRNLSDCAAMGCLPTAAVVTIAANRGTGIDYLRELYAGLREAGDAHGCGIVGGDTGSWPGKLAVTVTILGRGGGVRPVTQKGARPGDGIYVTGPGGGSILGRHMTFEPRVDLGRRLARVPVTSMIDLSDGLSRDLGHLCEESGVGAVLDIDAIPIHADALDMGVDMGIDKGTEPVRRFRSALDHAMNDGEDYELLYTAPAGAGELPGTRIGLVTAARGVLLSDGTRLEPRGWEHAL